jgi:hypothetical protein
MGRFARAMDRVSRGEIGLLAALDQRGLARIESLGTTAETGDEDLGRGFALSGSPRETQDGSQRAYQPVEKSWRGRFSY